MLCAVIGIPSCLLLSRLTISMNAIHTIEPVVFTVIHTRILRIILTEKLISGTRQVFGQSIRYWVPYWCFKTLLHWGCILFTGAFDKTLQEANVEAVATSNGFIMNMVVLLDKTLFVLWRVDRAEDEVFPCHWAGLNLKLVLWKLPAFLRSMIQHLHCEPWNFHQCTGS